MFITLLFFIIGTTIGAYHLPFWTEDLPAFEPISLATSTGLGYGGAWGLSIIIFGLVTWFTIRIEKKKNPPKMAALPKTRDRKSTRLNSSHVAISYAVFCLKKKKHMCYVL